MVSTDLFIQNIALHKKSLEILKRLYLVKYVIGKNNEVAN